VFAHATFRWIALQAPGLSADRPINIARKNLLKRAVCAHRLDRVARLVNVHGDNPLARQHKPENGVVMQREVKDLDPAIPLVALAQWAVAIRTADCFKP
jgi:hypothetical protein